MPSQFGFRRRRGSGDEGAGWIYADLFLALTIVGLGSAVVTAGNAFGSDVSGPASTTVSSTTTLPVLRLSCVEFGIPLSSDVIEAGPTSIGSAVSEGVANEIAARGWSSDQARPGLAILSGGFNVDQDHVDGVRLAQAQVGLVRSSTPLLAGVEMRTTGARVIQVNGKQVAVGDAGNYVLVVYLVHSGPPTEENCEN